MIEKIVPYNIYMRCKGYKAVPLKTNGKILPANKNFVWKKTCYEYKGFYIEKIEEKVIPWTKTVIKFFTCNDMIQGKHFEYRTIFNPKKNKIIGSKRKEV